MKYIIGILIASVLFGFEVQDHSTKNISKINKWSGTYVNENGIVLNVKDETLIDFTFEIVNKKGECQESFHGKAVLNSATNASYIDKDNILTISLRKKKDGKIEVSETGFQHAPSCQPFSGIYKPSF